MDHSFNDSSTLLDAALGYAEKGWKIFPLVACTKKPLWGSGAVHDATDDPQTIRDWWTAHPQANIGLACGEPSGIDALDIDPRNGGDEGYRDLLDGRSEPDTCESRTGGGGRHRFFLHHPQAHNNSHLRPGVEFRSTGYYVILPPSIHESGRRYECDGMFGIDETPPADLPEWLLDEVRANRTSTFSGGQTLRLEKPIPEGQRNNQLMSVLGALRHRGAPRDLLGIVARSIRENWMAESAHPRNQLTDKELEGIVERAGNYSPDLFAYAAQEQARQLLDPNIAEKAKKEEEEEIVAVTWDGLVAMAQPTEWLVDGIVPYPGVAILQGDPGIGKTWLGLSMMLSVARGLKWLQQFHTRQGVVLAILGEEWAGAVQERMQMLARAMGIMETMSEQPVHYVMNQEVLLHKEESREMNPKLHRLIERIQPTLIVFDPFLLTHHAEENDNSAMRGVMRLLDECAKIPEKGASVLVCHHVNKPKDREFASIQYRARGASAIVGHVDSILDVQGSFDHQIISHAKSNRGPVLPKWVVVPDFSKIHGTMVLGYEQFEAQDDQKDEKAERIVVEVLQEAVEPLSKTRISDIAQKRGAVRDRVRVAIDKLLEVGQIVDEKGPRGAILIHLAADPAPPAARCSDSQESILQEPLII